MDTWKENPKISVIIPVYNILDWLERCVQSVCRQTYKNLEILLVDDGSTDGTGKLCDSLAEKDSRIRVFHKENGGSSSARNLGMRKATGDYVGFVDSDDYIDLGMYEAMVTRAVSGNFDIVQISRDEIDEDGKKRPDVCIPPESMVLCGAQDFLRELLLHRGDCSFCTKLIKRELLKGKSFPEGKLNEDFRLLTELLEEGKEICILPEQMYHVFYRIGSNTRRKDKNDFSRVFVDIVENADYVQQLVWKSFPALKKEAVRFGLYQRLDYLLHIPVGQMNRRNGFYTGVKKYLRKNWLSMLGNPYLSGKNKVYLALLTLAPKTVRQIHGLLMAARQS